jgi:hypothetical protein
LLPVLAYFRLTPTHMLYFLFIVGRLRANWNSGLEKGLVEILQDHNNDCYKGQNGLSSKAWNRIVKLFHEKFPYVTFTKCQIQDKEKELKRDYKALKEARQQSGVSWDSGCVE